ncbi:hypothetical protein Tco_0847492, partial [Tanacetum coccineum]
MEFLFIVQSAIETSRNENNDELLMKSNANVLEGFYTSAGNPGKEILLKLNLPDHRILKDGGEVKEFQRSFRHSDIERLSRSDEVLKLKNFKKDATLKLSKSTNQEWYLSYYLAMEVPWPGHCGTNGVTLSVTVYCSVIVVDGGECPTPHPPLLLHVDLSFSISRIFFSSAAASGCFGIGVLHLHSTKNGSNLNTHVILCTHG